MIKLLQADVTLVRKSGNQQEMLVYHPGLYYRLRYTKLSGFTNLPGKLGKLATVSGYRLARKIYQFQ